MIGLSMINAPKTSSRANILPVSLSRIGGLPVSAIPAPEKLIESLLAGSENLEQEISKIKDSLIEKIYSSVPESSKELRRALLESKRNVFNGKEINFSLLRQLPDSLDNECKYWNQAVRSLEEFQTELNLRIIKNNQVESEQIVNKFLEPDFLKSVSIASPQLVTAVENLDPTKIFSDQRMVRSSYAYITRAALKTSPFSGLTTVAVSGKYAAGRMIVNVAKHFPYQMLRTLTTKAIENNNEIDLKLETSPSVEISVDGHKNLILIPDFHYRNGIIYRNETVKGAENVPRRLRELKGTYPVNEFKSQLKAINPDIRLQRYVDSGIVRPSVPWSRDESPFAKIQKIRSSEINHCNTQELSWIVSAEQNIPQLDAFSRAHTLNRMGDFASKYFTEDEMGKKPSGLLYEDREYSGFVDNYINLQPVREDLEKLADLCNPWIVRSRLYDLMVSRFCARYGEGGTCNDVLGFLMSQAVDGDGNHEEFIALRQDHAFDESKLERAGLMGGISAAPRNIGAFVQLCADSEENLSSGSGLTVVNAFGSGSGGAYARFHKLLGSEYRNELATQIHSMWSVERVYELQFWTEINTGQNMSTGVLPALRVPGEPTVPGSISLSDVSLKHDSDSDTLYLVDSEGPIGLAYLGLTPQHLLSGYLRWLTLISDPWIRLTPYSDHWSSHMWQLRKLLADETVEVPRTQQGRLVTRRGSWYVPRVTIDSLFANDAVGTIRAWHKFRSKLDMPEEVFVHQLARAQGSTVNSRKPLYTNLSSPLSLTVLEKWLAPESSHVRITEALPTTDMHPFRDDKGRPRAREEYVSFFWKD